MKQSVIFLTFFLLASCAQSIENSTTIELGSTEKIIDEKKALVDNALKFINSYVENCNKLKESDEIMEWVNSNNLTSNNFKTELKRLKNEANKQEPEIGLEADPIFDAQDYPDKGFELDSFDNKNFVVVQGINWPDFKLTIKMVLENNNWIVDGSGIINIPKEKRIKRN